MTANPNTQPRFIRDNLLWQVSFSHTLKVPYEISTVPPLKVGDAGEHGALIESIWIDAADAGYMVLPIRFYLQFPENLTYYYFLGVTPNQGTAINGVDRAVQIRLPRLVAPVSGVTEPSRGLRMPAGSSLFVGFADTIVATPSGRLYLCAMGGQY